MKQVVIVGLGMSANTLTAEGRRAVEQADVLLGAPRLTEQFAHLEKPCYAEYAADRVARIVRENEGERFCLLVSGDSGFYSAAESLCAQLADHSLSVIPGISSLSYFFASLRRPWQEARLLSCHGREANLVEAVRRNPLTFALTGDNLAELGEQLTQAGFAGLTACVGENLGSRRERIITLPVSGLADAEIGKLAVLLVENPEYDRRLRFGIADDEFIRGSVPMTKAEVRAVTMSKLALRPCAVCCDIGAGTGSLTVEMALAAYEGIVYSLDRSDEAMRLVRGNCRAFHIGNVKPVLGEAPAALAQLPPLDAAFIGGSAGRLAEIFSVLMNNNPRIRIVLNAVTLETVQAAAEAFAAHGIHPEIIQLGVTWARPVGNTRMLQAGSPVFIFSGGGNE